MRCDVIRWRHFTDGGSSEDPRLPLLRRLRAARLSVPSPHRRTPAGLLARASVLFQKGGGHREPLRKTDYVFSGIILSHFLG